ncbi:MAG: hypothetical protein HQK49_12720 [Oligoflexia bacterium]|nr:hypothetical protein [Oligoflexia bacterium]
MSPSVQLKLTSPKLTGEDEYSGTFKGTNKGIILGYYNRINPVMLMATYYFSAIYEYGNTKSGVTRSNDEGTGWALSLSIVSYKPASIFIQYKTLSLTSKGLNASNESVGSNKLKTTEILVGLGFQLWL